MSEDQDSGSFVTLAVGLVLVLFLVGGVMLLLFRARSTGSTRAVAVATQVSEAVREAKEEVDLAVLRENARSGPASWVEDAASGVALLIHTGSEAYAGYEGGGGALREHELHQFVEQGGGHGFQSGQDISIGRWSTETPRSSATDPFQYSDDGFGAQRPPDERRHLAASALDSAERDSRSVLGPPIELRGSSTDWQLVWMRGSSPSNAGPIVEWREVGADLELRARSVEGRPSVVAFALEGDAGDRLAETVAHADGSWTGTVLRDDLGLGADGAYLSTGLRVEEGIGGLRLTCELRPVE